MASRVHAKAAVSNAHRLLEFWEFCELVLKLKLTTGQRVVAKVAFGDQNPSDLEGEERELAVQMFGGLEDVPDLARRFICLRLGRGSGKTTLCSAYSVYTAVCQVVNVGPGDTPVVITVAPDKPTAQLAISMCREMIRLQPALNRLVVAERETFVTIRRPDGLQVRIEAFAAAARGSSFRGRTILSFLMDEAEFFTSSLEEGRTYAVNDVELFRAMKPRLVRGGKGMLVSTPWPVETLMGKLFEENWGKPKSACAVKAPTLLVRGGDPDIEANVREEFERDPENARREYDCELDTTMGGGYFDGISLVNTVGEGEMPGRRNPLFPISAACDLGFKSDSSSLAIVQYTGDKYELLYLCEDIPKLGKPLVPSEVITKYAKIALKYGCRTMVSDGHYRETVREHLTANGISLVDAPEGTRGKEATFSRVRSVLHDGKVSLPKCQIVSRLVAQAKMVTSRPTAGGFVTIKVPRRSGMGHGDLVSCWVLAVHALAHKNPKKQAIELEPGTPEWQQEFDRRIAKMEADRNRRALRDAEKEVRSRMNGKRYRELFAGR